MPASGGTCPDGGCTATAHVRRGALYRRAGPPAWITPAVPVGTVGTGPCCSARASRARARGSPSPAPAAVARTAAHGASSAVRLSAPRRARCTPRRRYLVNHANEQVLNVVERRGGVAREDHARVDRPECQAHVAVQRRVARGQRTSPLRPRSRGQSARRRRQGAGPQGLQPRHVRPPPTPAYMSLRRRR